MRNLLGRRLRLVLAGVVIGVAIVAVFVLVARTASGPSGGERASAGGEAGESEAAREREEHAPGKFDPRKEARFERTTGEADRKGPDNPAGEQVDNRAF